MWEGLMDGLMRGLATETPEQVFKQVLASHDWPAILQQDKVHVLNKPDGTGIMYCDMTT
jgi:hypothetical protein